MGSAGLAHGVRRGIVRPEVVVSREAETKSQKMSDHNIVLYLLKSPNRTTEAKSPVGAISVNYFFQFFR